ncbi:Respiratory burst oxidaseprotein F [Abeliophyllum distichum]|uniref:Respiratory burst oxidaseprotein F n=1 Tax=Abeliophyllum distichum TaxID=126358 RepID=A0ABD1SE80_9LAMI
MVTEISQELKAKAIAKAKQFSQELKAELRQFSWSHGHATRVLSGGAEGGSIALVTRAMRQQRAQLDQTRSSTHKALEGLKFISNGKTNSWNEVENNFYKLAKDRFVHRSDFAKCIG